MKISHKLTVVLLFVLFLLAGVAYAMTVAQIRNNNMPSIVTIVALDENDQPLKLGSGMFVGKNGEIATNRHVLEGSAKAIVKTMDGRTGEIIEITNDSHELDLVIAKTTLENTKPIPLGDSDLVTIGEEIVAIGNPEGFEGSVSNGIISGIRKNENIKYIQITAPVSPGSSGGPVFNKAGKVIGIATASLASGQNLNFAMPVNYLKTIKLTSVKLAQLENIGMSPSLEADNELIRPFDIHLDIASGYGSDAINGYLVGVDYGLRNGTKSTIYNIDLLIIYTNYKGEIVSYSRRLIGDEIPPNLALQFNNDHRVKYFSKMAFNGYTGYQVDRSGSIEIRILNYMLSRK